MVTFYKIIIPTRDMYQSIQDAYSQTFEFTSAHQFIVWLILSI